MIGSRNLAVCTAVTVTMLGLLMFTSCSHRRAVPGEGASGTVPAVPTVTPTWQPVTRLIQQPCYVKPYEQTPIYSKIAGYVLEIPVDINDNVPKGGLLAKLWVPEMEQDLKSKEARVTQARADVTLSEEGLRAAKANVDTMGALVSEAKAGVTQTEADVKRWQSEYDRAENLLAQRVYDKQTRDEALSQLRQASAGRTKARARVTSAEASLIESKARQGKAEAEVAAAKAKLQVAQADSAQSAAWLDYRNIRAPYAGVVTVRNVHTGAFLQSSSSGSTNKAAEPLFVMMRMDKMRVNAQVPEYDAVLVKEGMPAVIHFQALHDQEFSGKVTRFTWSFDEHARTLRVEVHLENPKHVLRPGMYGNMTISVHLPSAFTLPSEALMTDGDQTYCYAVENGKAVRTVVRVGTRSARLTQVLQKRAKATSSGTEGDWVDFSGKEEIVASKPASLIDGQAVAVKVHPR